MAYLIKFKRLICLFLVLFVFNVCDTYAASGNGDLIVHITKTGACYHTSGCGSLKSDIEITLEEAFIEGYQRCDRCNPPVYTGDQTREIERQKSESGSDSDISIERKQSNKASVYYKTKSKSDYLGKVVGILVFGYFGSMILVHIGSKHIDKRRTKQQVNNKKLEIEKRRNTYLSECKGREVHEIVGAPSNIRITKKGEIQDIEGTVDKPFGENTVFIIPAGKIYCYFANIYPQIRIKKSRLSYPENREVEIVKCW